MFKALLLEKDESGFRAGVRAVDEAGLPEGDVPVRRSRTRRSTTRTAWRSPTAARWCAPGRWSPASTVPAPCSRASHADWKPGDRVVHNGWGVGETRWGCLAERARLKGDWLVQLPAAFTHAPGDGDRHRRLHRDAVRARARAPRRARRRRRGARHRRDRRRRQRRHRACSRASATASSPRPARPTEADYLQQLGAAEVIDRAELAAPGKPLQKERWSAAVDAVGSHTLVNVLAQTRYGGVVAACGLAQGHDLPAHGDALHPARRHARRHRQRDGADRRCARRPGSGWRATSIRRRSS